MLKYSLLSNKRFKSQNKQHRRMTSGIETAEFVLVWDEDCPVSSNMRDV
jgi:hypothetical protein